MTSACSSTQQQINFFELFRKKNFQARERVTWYLFFARMQKKDAN